MKVFIAVLLVVFLVACGPPIQTDLFSSHDPVPGFESSSDGSGSDAQ